MGLAHEPQPPRAASREKDRRGAFSVGIIAVIITILVLDLKVPQGKHGALAAIAPVPAPLRAAAIGLRALNGHSATEHRSAMPVARMRSLTAWLAALVAVHGAAQAVAQPARPVDAPPISIELNKLERPEMRAGAAGNDCRVYVVLDNRSSESYQTLQLDLIFFRTDGVIGRRLAVDMAPLPSAKKSVKLFDVAGMECPSIGQVLVNDIMACRDAAGKAVEDCLNKIALSSRAPDISLVK